MDITQHTSPTTVNFVMRNQQAELDERAISALLRKIDIWLMPLLTLAFFFSFLDRINIGHADSFGLKGYLKLSSIEYKWTESIFLISYMLCTIPSTLLMRRFGSSKWIAILMCTWGIIVILMISVYNLPGLLVARFFLGMAESGFVPGVIFYLSLWYIRKDQAYRMGIFFSGAAFASAFDGIVAYAVTQIDNGGSLNKWRWLCLVEGVPTVCLAIVIYKLLADPATVKWLDQCNKDILTTRLLADVKMIGDADNESLSQQIRSVCLDWKVWFYIFIYIGATTPLYGLNSFLPTIINDTFYTSATNATNAATELLTIPPYCASSLTIIISSWNAGRLNERSNHIMILLLIQISGFFYLILAKKYLYIGTIIVGIGVLSSNALTLSWITNNIGEQTKRAVVLALVIALGNVGSILGEQIYRESDKDSYIQRHWIVIGVLCFTCILVLLLKLLLKYENRRRRILATVQLHTETVAGEKRIVLDMHPDFVYVT